jgi:hypothetical protein
LRDAWAWATLLLALAARATAVIGFTFWIATQRRRPEVDFLWRISLTGAPDGFRDWPQDEAPSIDVGQTILVEASLQNCSRGEARMRNRRARPRNHRRCRKPRVRDCRVRESGGRYSSPCAQIAGSERVEARSCPVVMCADRGRSLRAQRRVRGAAVRAVALDDRRHHAVVHVQRRRRDQLRFGVNCWL